MALSGTITYSLTASDAIDFALQKLGIIGGGESPNADDGATALMQLNLMLKSWAMQGPNLWGRAEQTVTLIDGTQNYTLSPQPATVENVRFAVDGVETRPLTEWSRNDWDRAPIKTSEGEPVIYVVDRQRASTILTLWPIPADFTALAWTLVVSYERRLQDIATISQDIDVPQEWLETVGFNLAKKLRVDFPPSAAHDLARHKMIQEEADALLAGALTHDRQGSVRLVRRAS